MPSVDVRAILSSSLLVISLAACTAGAPATAPSASAPAKLNVSYSSISFAQIALPVADETGILAKNGLQIQLTLSSNGVPSLLSGEVQAAVTSAEEIILADLGGADLISVGAMVPYLQHRLLVRPEIKTAADLKGRPVGVTKRGNLTETVVRMGLQRGGLDPDKDVQYVELGGADKQVAALAAGATFAASLSPPYDQLAEGQGAHVLFDFPPEHIKYPVAHIIVSRQWANKNEALVLALLRSMSEAAALTRTQPDKVAAIYAKWAKSGDDAAQAAVKTAQQAVQTRFQIDSDGMKAVVDTVAQTRPAAANVDPSRFFDDRYLKKLDEQGFFASLPA